MSGCVEIIHNRSVFLNQIPSPRQSQGLFIRPPQDLTQDGVFKVPMPRKPQTQPTRTSSSAFNNNLPSMSNSNNKENVLDQLRQQQIKRKIQQIQFQQVISKLNTENFLKRMKFLASLPENSDATFNIPIHQISFITFVLSDLQIDTYIQLNKLIVHNQKADTEENMEVDSEEDESPKNKEAALSEFKSSNRDNLIRIEKEVLFKVPKNYLDSYFEEAGDESTEDLSVKSSNSIKQEDEDDIAAQNGEQKIGNYSLSQRSKKIMKYKSKKMNRRKNHPISKAFTGRKAVALNKFRLNGKFAKKQQTLVDLR